MVPGVRDRVLVVREEPGQTRNTDLIRPAILVGVCVRVLHQLEVERGGVNSDGVSGGQVVGPAGQGRTLIYQCPHACRHISVSVSVSGPGQHLRHTHGPDGGHGEEAAVGRDGGPCIGVEYPVAERDGGPVDVLDSARAVLRQRRAHARPGLGVGEQRTSGRQPTGLLGVLGVDDVENRSRYRPHGALRVTVAASSFVPFG